MSGSTKSRVKGLVDEREEGLEQQKAAALRDAQDEDATLKGVVENKRSHGREKEVEE
jgi:hypothetical protein